MLSYLRKSKVAAKFILMIFAFSLIGVTPAPAPAQEQYPGVARLSFVSGPVTYSRGDDPDEWDDAIENVPVTIGDRIYAPEDGRAELQISSGNFVRLAPRSYLSTLNLSDDIKQFYLGEGAASFNIKRLRSDEVIEIDTPNVSVTLEEPGQYRVAVDDDGNSRVTVRRGRATVAASGRQIAVENSEIRVYGIDSPRYEIVGLPGIDAFDRWVSERDNRFERAYADAYRHASEDIIGAEDLAEYGRWEEIPEYGYAWTPSRVAAGWAPFSNGRWYWQDPWGWSWISNERWGWATSHYGRWTPHRSRWYWVPVRPRTRVRYAPASVEFVRVRDHVGWFPLHPRDRHTPWWERRDRQRFDRNVTYVNRTHVTVVNHNTFITARPVNKYIVRDSVIIRDARSARFTESLPIPNRSSLRIVSDNGGRRGHRPSDKIINRVAVVRTAVPASPRAFQDKLPEIQKNQGKAVEPARILAAARDDRRVRVRPAAEAGRGDFAPRNPGAASGPALQPLTEARGKKLATGKESAASKTERTDRAEKTAAPPAPSKGTASRPESPRVEQDRDRQRQEKQTPERERQAQQQEERKTQLQKQQQERQERQAQQQKQRELERRQAQKEEERKVLPQKQQATQERQSAQQRLEERERRQAQQREEERKTQPQQNRQEQERREQLRQQQLQERQAQQQRQQEQQRRQRQEQQEQTRKAQAQQQQEQARREQQLRQQQAQERQARDQQRQEVERRQQQQQREQQERNAQAQRQEQLRAQQLRQQQAQEQRKAQQTQRQQEQERRPQPQKEPLVPQGSPRQPGPF
jgi:DNA segregation ATPase FtsK/SpoIIIE-like protein